MKAMVLAAGVGSRLAPLTNTTPKALLTVAGRPLIEIVLRRLAAAGVDRVIVNVFHHAEQMERALVAWSRPGFTIAISREETLLDTGGGLKKAASFLAGDEPFFLHNADVVSGVDLGRLRAAHLASGALATLSVRKRAGARQLLFDERGLLAGWENSATGERIGTGTPGDPAGSPFGFDGIQVVAPEIFSRLHEEGAFSLTRAYLRLAAAGERIMAFDASACFWADAGTKAKLAAIERHVAAHGWPD
jgi:NDP-sugar pyrophosphorylase family protein